MRHLLPVLLLLSACGPGESSFPTSTGSINTDWNEDEDAPDPFDTADDDDDGGDNDGGNDGGNDGNGGGSTGGDLYVQNCVDCHGPDGEGSSGAPALAGEIDTLTDSELTDIILNGTGDMPDVGLSVSEAETLVAWLRNAWQ